SDTRTAGRGLGHDVPGRGSDDRDRRDYGRQRAERFPDHAHIQHPHVAGLRASRVARAGRASDASMVWAGLIRNGTDSGYARCLRLSLVTHSAGRDYYSCVLRSFLPDNALRPGRYAWAGALVQEPEYARRCCHGTEGFRGLHGSRIPFSEPYDFLHWIVESGVALPRAAQSADDGCLVCWAHGSGGRVSLVRARNRERLRANAG